MYIIFEYAACLVLVAFLGTLLFAVCALLIPLSEGAADIMGRLMRGIAHEGRDLERGLTGLALCRRVRSQAGRVCGSGLAKEVAMFQMVNEEPRRPQERRKMVLMKVVVFSVALLLLSAIVCFFAFLPYTNR